MTSTKDPNVYKRTDLTYNDYLKVPELLSLQHPMSAPAHHDEMLFIIIHQAYELWFKLVLHEVEQASLFLKKSDFLRARHFVQRAVEIFRVLIPQIHILETMSPIDFLEFRDGIAPASGFQSLQFRELEFALGLQDENYLKYFANRPDYLEKLRARMATPTVAALLDQSLKVSLKEIYENPSKHFEEYMLCESFISLDQSLILWREHHVRVVERVIGFKMGTGGSSGVEYLRQTTIKKCFPKLWQVRSELEKRNNTGLTHE